VLAEGNGSVICLRAEPQLLLERLQADVDSRPLLAGNAAETLASLLATREGHYNSFHHQFNANQSPAQLVSRLQATLGRFHLSSMGNYDVIIDDGGLEQLGEMLRRRGIEGPIVVTDENVARLHAARAADSLQRSGYEHRTLIIPAGESRKTRETVDHLWHGFLEAGLDRKSTVIALGGGVVGDLAGFAASTFMRGIDWVCVPTSLLSMVDASLGGKTGFDLPEGKNLIGSFHAPRLVLADPTMLATLPEMEFRAGLAEVVKHGVVADPELFDLCAYGLGPVKERLPEILRRAIAVKVRIIESDPYERGARVALNLGHTVGHAIEVVSDFRVRHGEAVAMGMVAEAKLAERLTVARAGLSEQIAEALSALGLPVRVPQALPRQELIRAMYADKKKTAGKIRFAMVTEIGHVRTNVEVADLELAFKQD